jgi:hypothetical protein
MDTVPKGFPGTPRLLPKSLVEVEAWVVTVLPIQRFLRLEVSIDDNALDGYRMESNVSVINTLLLHIVRRRIP